MMNDDKNKKTTVLQIIAHSISCFALGFAIATLISKLLI